MTPGTLEIQKQLVFSWAVLLAACFATCKLSAETQVPRWDARGVGMLPRHGIACVDVALDGTIVVGTIAPAGHPNVFKLNATGALVSRHEAGQRWIGEVAAVARGQSYALCTTPAGRADDFPTIYYCAEADAVVEVPAHRSAGHRVLGRHQNRRRRRRPTGGLHLFTIGTFS